MGTVRRAIKHDARAALKGRWNTAVLITLLMMLVGFVVGLFEGVIPLMLGAPSFFGNLAQSADPWQAALSSAPWFLLFTALMGMVSLVFVAPMNVGAADWYMGCTDRQENSLAHIFWPFGCKKFWGSLVVFAAYYLLCLFWSVLFLALPGALIGLAVYNLYFLNLAPMAQTLTILGLVAAVLFLLVVMVFLQVFLTRYSLALYLMGRKYGKGPIAALRMSARITRGHRFETFGFMLSFLPWIVLNVLVVPMFFSIPYMMMSFALYTRYLTELYENKGQTPVTLPAYEEGPALPDAEETGLSFGEAVVDEVVEEPPVEDIAEEATDQIIEVAEAEIAEEKESLSL